MTRLIKSLSRRRSGGLMKRIDEYHFQNQGIIFAYRDGAFSGVFVTEEDETFTKKELMECFEGHADYLVAADLAEWTINGTEDDVRSRVQFLIEMAMDGDLSYFNIKYHIPKYLH
jgi:hypothetical protein